MANLTNQPSITILGSGGGVAKAILSISILNQAVQDKNDPLHELLQKSEFHLIDIEQKSLQYFENLFPYIKKQIFLYELDLSDLDSYKNHLQKTNTSVVIDVSWADTNDILFI
jgi:hypothetical protein